MNRTKRRFIFWGETMAGSKNGSQKKASKLSYTQKIYENLLGIGACLLVLMHFLIVQTRYIHDFYYTTRPIECWYTVILIIAAVTYLILSLTIWRETSSRIKNFFLKLRTPEQIFCAVLFLWYILTCLVNTIRHSYNFFIDNDWWILDTAVNCLVVFSLPMVVTEETAKKLIHALLHIVGLIGTVFAFYCLRRLFLLDFVILPIGGAIGMTSDMTFFMACHYNISSAIQLCIITICIYMIASQKLPLKILYGAALLINTYALILNNSRAAFVACMAAYALAVFLAVWNLVQKPAAFRWAAGLGGAAVCAGILWVLRPLSFQVFEDITHFSEIMAAQSELSSSINYALGNGIPAYLRFNSGFYSSPVSESFSLPALPFILGSGRKKYGKIFAVSGAAVILIGLCVFLHSSYDFETAYSSNADAVSSRNGYLTERNAFYEENKPAEIHTAAGEGEQAVRKMSAPMNRKKVWKAAIKVIKSDAVTMIFGVTPTAVSDALKNIGGLKGNYAHAHNELLQMGVSMGVPMMVLYFVFMISMIIKCVRLGMFEGKDHFQGAYMIPVIIASQLVLNLVEAYLFGYFSLMSSLFFLSCGWIHSLTIRRQETKEQNQTAVPRK